MGSPYSNKAFLELEVSLKALPQGIFKTVQTLLREIKQDLNRRQGWVSRAVTLPRQNPSRLFLLCGCADGKNHSPQLR